MRGRPMSAVTRVLSARERGDRRAATDLLLLVYDELQDGVLRVTAGSPQAVDASLPRPYSCFCSTGGVLDRL